jgi:zinc transport system substrate-binding protein
MFTCRAGVLSLLLFAGLGMVVWVVGCSPAPDPWGGKPTPHILVSVPPLYSFAKSVAGDHGDVKCLCTTSGPHSYEFSQTDLRTLRGATRFLSIGLGLDDKFSNGMVQATGQNDLLVKLGDKLPGDMRFDFTHENGTRDPHVWNGTPQASKMVEQIRDELKKADPANAADYDKNAAAYLKKLEELHTYGHDLLKDKKNKKIISFHESLGYFAREFDIDIVDVIEVEPGREIDAMAIRKIVNDCIDKKVLVIAVEPQYSPQSAELIHKEVKAAAKDDIDVKLVEIDPLETVDAEKDLTADLYIKTMRNNLKALADNLK